MRDRKGVNRYQRSSGKKLEKAEGGETVTGIYHVGKKSISKNRKKFQKMLTKF